jgi:sugar lactone lactonase YvrE
MFKLLKLLAVLLILLALYLWLWPVPISALAWQPPTFRGYVGPHERNQRLADLQLVSLAPEVGPEHIAFGPDGRLYTGLVSGVVMRMNPDGSDVETYVTTHGRPLGLDFDADGRLVIADALRGLLVVEPDGTLHTLTDTVAGAPIRYADAVKVATDGRMLLTDASTRFSPRQFGTFHAALLDVLEQSCTGRVLEFDPATSVTRIVAQGLCFPNGVELTADESELLVAETATYRVLRLPRAADALDVRRALREGTGEVTVVLDNLPGFPDNLTRGADGRYWTGLTKPRSKAIDDMAAKPWLRELTLRLPRFLWPVPPAYSHVLAFDADGRVLLDLQDPTGRLPETSGATEHEGRLYVQSLHSTAFGILPLSLPAPAPAPAPGPDPAP